jgi:subtilisin family serine protease
MRRVRSHLFVIVVGLAVPLLTGAAHAAPAAPAPVLHGPEKARVQYVPRQALVRFRRGVSVGVMNRLALKRGGRVTKSLPRAPGGGRAAVVRSASLSTAELVAELAADPRVLRAEPDYLLRLEAIPDDPDLPALWGMPRIRAPRAWDLTTGSPSVVLASVDTGVDYTHPDLAANMWRNPGEIAGNGLDDDENGYVDDVHGIAEASDAADPSDPMDVQGHGTHTAGTMAAVGDNGTGVTGVAWQARIMALRFFRADGLGATSDAISCIDYAVAMKERGVNVVAINASWGNGEVSAFLRWAVETAGDAGIVVVAAAGNGSADKIGDDNDAVPYYPASYDSPNVIAVGASDGLDQLAEFSDYGAASVDLVAPGAGIRSTVPTSTDPGGYASKDGTSMAAPHVTGTIALCAALHPGESVAERIARVLASADPVASLAGKCVTGGRLDVLGAVDTEAPVTTATGIDGAWHASAVTVSFSALDAGSGVAYVESRLDDGDWVRGTARTVAGDASHTLAFRAVDDAGNREATRRVTVRVDAGRPTPLALSDASARRGRRATLWYRINDVTPRATCRIRIYKGARTVKTLRPGLVMTNLARTHAWTCRLAPGRYTWRVFATDQAGNTQGKPGTRRLTVR